MNLRLSPKHGVNPTIPVCFYCLKEKNEVLLLGRMKPTKDTRGVTVDSDPEAPRRAVFDKEPCKECKGFMERGIVLISVLDADEGKSNPHRTGGWVVVKDEAIQRWLPAKIADHILHARFAFVPDGVWGRLGLPVGTT